jgi:hypothetical protein
VHEQLWQSFFQKGMWKKQLSAVSFGLAGLRMSGPALCPVQNPDDFNNVFANAINGKKR